MSSVWDGRVMLVYMVRVVGGVAGVMGSGGHGTDPGGTPCTVSGS